MTTLTQILAELDAEIEDHKGPYRDDFMVLRGLRRAREIVLAAQAAAPKPAAVPECDCECPEPEHGVALVSMTCPIHNSPSDYQHRSAVAEALSAAPSPPSAPAPTDTPPLTIDYTNYRGERALRQIQPIRVYHGSTEWHLEPQWLLVAFDTTKGEERIFAMKDIHAIGSAPAPGDETDAYAILYPEPGMRPEIFTSHGAREAALRRFEQSSSGWNCHLFQRIRVGRAELEAAAQRKMREQIAAEAASTSREEVTEKMLDAACLAVDEPILPNIDIDYRELFKAAYLAMSSARSGSATPR